MKPIRKAWLIFAAMLWTVPLTSAAPEGAKALFCAYQGVGYTGPSGSERQYAVAVVEIESAKKIRNASLADFALIDQSGKETKLSRIVQVEIFERHRVASEGEFAYYLNSGGTRPWDGTLPAGKIQLRARVAFTERTSLAVRFRLVIGAQIIEGTVNGRLGS
jgi:hypothetical protein